MINPKELISAYKLGIFPMAESRKNKKVITNHPKTCLFKLFRFAVKETGIQAKARDLQLHFAHSMILENVFAIRCISPTD